MRRFYFFCRARYNQPVRIPFHLAVLLVVAVLVGLVTTANAQLEATLQTADTVATLRATPSGPALVSLGSPGLHAWENLEPEPLVDFAQVRGVRVPLHWKFNAGASRVRTTSVMFAYDSSVPRLRLAWTWSKRAAFGPIEHSISIENQDDSEIELPLQQSLCWAWQLSAHTAYEMLSVEKGGGAPGPVGTSIRTVPDGARWGGFSSTYAREIAGRPREIIPFLLVQEARGSRSGFYLGVEFSGRTRIILERRGNQLSGKAGLNPEPALSLTRLAPQETFRAPIVFVGASRGGVETAGNRLRRWIRGTLADSPAKRDPGYPYLVLNSWGSGMAIDEALARRMLQDAADLGLEMFHVDAGWFRTVGDWTPDPRKFPYGLAAIADEAHRAGMKFGLWVDWTQAGLGRNAGALNVNDPGVRDWLIADPPEGWKPEPFKGMTIDLGVPASADWARQETQRIVSGYHLDMLEHDGYLVAQGCMRSSHPHLPPDAADQRIEMEGPSPFVISTNSADVSRRATDAYYGVQDALRKLYPGLLLEICNDGGRMVDFGSAAHGDYFSITDAYDPLSNRRAFFDASHLLPPAMLETYVEKWPVPRMENFLYMLRSGMMGWFSLMQDPHDWTPEQRAAAKREFAFYRESLRPLIRSADLYHLTSRPDGAGWDAVEYFDPAEGMGAVYVFRGSGPESATRIPLRGLRAGRRYSLQFRDHPESNTSKSAEELLSDGPEIKLHVANSSEIILLHESPARGRGQKE